jgi:LPXTG-motif cell wall-anchored protein
MQTSTRLKLAATFAFATASVVPMSALAPASGPSSTVVYVGGNDLVLKATDGTILNYMVPAGVMFSAGGKQVALAQLTPGTMLTAAVSTGSDPQVVAGITTMKAKVYGTTPPDGITLTTAMGAKDFVVPTGSKFMVGGKSLGLTDLASDVTIDATVITPAAPDAGAVPPPATPAMSGTLLVLKTDDLPSAGTNLPLYGLIGLALMLAGFVVLRFRKPVGMR